MFHSSLQLSGHNKVYTTVEGMMNGFMLVIRADLRYKVLMMVESTETS